MPEAKVKGIGRESPAAGSLDEPWAPHDFDWGRGGEAWMAGFRLGSGWAASPSPIEAGRVRLQQVTLDRERSVKDAEDINVA